MRFATLAAAVFSLAAIGQPAIAQVPAGVQPGMTVKDSAGGVVGTVARTDSANITVRTGKHDIPVPGASFTLDGKVLLFGLTQAQLDAQYEQSVAQAQAALQAGLPVKGAGGEVVGTIAAIDDEQVTIEVAGGTKVVLARTAIAGSPDGAVIGLTAEQLTSSLTEAPGQ